MFAQDIVSVTVDRHVEDKKYWSKLKIREQYYWRNSKPDFMRLRIIAISTINNICDRLCKMR